jgi:phage gp36-like protein
MPIRATPIVSTGYVDRTYMEVVRGVKNIAQWSNKDNDTEIADDAAIEAAIATASAIIDTTLGGSYVVPFDVAEDASGATILRRWAEILASYELNVARGMQDNNPAQADLSAQREQVLAEMGEFVADANGSAAKSFASFTKIEPRTPLAPIVVI